MGAVKPTFIFVLCLQVSLPKRLWSAPVCVCVCVCVCLCVCTGLTCVRCPASLHQCYYCTRCSCAAHRRSTAAFTNHTCPFFSCFISVFIFSGRTFMLQWSFDEDHSVSARWNDGESKLYSPCFSVSLFCQVSSNMFYLHLYCCFDDLLSLQFWQREHLHKTSSTGCISFYEYLYFFF